MTQMTEKRPSFQIVVVTFLLLFLGGIVTWSLKVGPSFWRLGGVRQKSLEGPGNFGTVPDFSLVERSNRTINLHDLRGKIWIANFIFTACNETCPTQSAALAGLQSNLDLKGKIKLVSITVDPKRDTPEVLTQYASRFGAHPEHWLFLTGKQEEIYRLAQQGFRLGAAQVPDGNNNPAYIHSSRLVLVDREAKIRGYYESNDPQALHKLTHDIKLILGQDKTHG
jgi:protein SCO1/2